MRVIALMFGMLGFVGAAAAEDLYASRDSDAMTAQLVFETRFGGEHGAPVSRSFQLQVASEGQRLQGIAPLRAEFRQGTGQFLLNGVDLKQAHALIARQAEDSEGLAALWGGFLPVVIVVGAATLIVVDGNNQDFTPGGSGGS